MIDDKENPVFSHGLCGVELSDEGLYFMIRRDDRFCECVIEIDETGKFEVRANDHLVGKI